MDETIRSYNNTVKPENLPMPMDIAADPESAFQQAQAHEAAGRLDEALAVL